MIVRVPKETEYYPKYIGWYVFTTEAGAKKAELEGKAPKDFLIKPMNTRGIITYPGELWMWRLEVENEFGPVSP